MLAYNLKRVMKILGNDALIAAMRAGAGLFSCSSPLHRGHDPEIQPTTRRVTSPVAHFLNVFTQSGPTTVKDDDFNIRKSFRECDVDYRLLGREKMIGKVTFASGSELARLFLAFAASSIFENLADTIFRLS